MTKAKEHPTQHKEVKEKDPKGKSKLVGRVKKVIKKSRRKLGEEKFEKELQRTIEFLAALQVKLNNHPEGSVTAEAEKKVEKKSVKKVEKKANKKTARNEAKKARPRKKSAKKPASEGADKKGNGAGHKGAPVLPAAEPVSILQIEAQPLERQSGEQ